MANRSSFGPMVLVIAAMSCSFYVACGDDDVIIGNGGSAGTGGSGGRGGTAGTGGTGGSAGTAGTAGTTGEGGTAGTTGEGGTAGTAGDGGTGGTGDVDPDAGVDAGDGGVSSND